MKQKIKQFFKAINIEIKDINLINQVINHKSYDHNCNYEKLEFLGDRVLGLIISKTLIDLYPNEKVGFLDKKLSTLVNKKTCYLVGKKLNLEKFINVGNTSNKNLIESKIISDCCEALIGAIYLEHGLNITNKYVLNLWNEYINIKTDKLVDSKTQLQEYSLKKFKLLPIYKTISNEGPKHKPNFIVGVKLKNTKYVQGKGSSKKEAEQSAAETLIKLFKI
tara:strand:+ start:510 stop:1172 length:663 start_codon:yes stop_codon:yes gene_type:complete